MANKNKDTILWIIGIVVAILLMAQLGVGKGTFAIAGGGAGSSISQSISPTLIEVDASAYGEGIWQEYIIIVRPPIGETWLITAISWNLDYTLFSSVEPPTSGITVADWDYFWDYNVHQGIPKTDRLFIDHNFYIIDNVGPSDRIEIIGVRV